jgi:hypothetical protein
MTTLSLNTTSHRPLNSIMGWARKLARVCRLVYLIDPSGTRRKK